MVYNTGGGAITNEAANIDGDAALAVNQTPPPQLGKAPLDGFAGSDADQVEVLWQAVTVETVRDSMNLVYGMPED